MMLSLLVNIRTSISGTALRGRFSVRSDSFHGHNKCNVKRDWPLSGIFTRGFSPPAYRILAVNKNGAQ
jgi:hypothetical protein